jgi:hypothetical protein
MQSLYNIGLTTLQLATIFSMTRQAVDNMLAINKLAPEIKHAITNGEIKQTAALALKNLPHSYQVSVIKLLRELNKKPTTANIMAVLKSEMFTAKIQTNISAVAYARQLKRS